MPPKKSRTAKRRRPSRHARDRKRHLRIEQLESLVMYANTTFSWVGGAGDFQNPAMWTGGKAGTYPNSDDSGSDIANLLNGGTVTLLTSPPSPAATVGQLNVASGATTIDLSSQTLAVAAAMDVSNGAAGFQLDGPGTLDSAGVLNLGTPGYGSMTVQGGASVDAVNLYDGPGSVSVTNGALAVTGQANIGVAGSAGYLNVTGASSSINAPLNIGPGSQVYISQASTTLGPLVTVGSGPAGAGAPTANLDIASVQGIQLGTSRIIRCQEPLLARRRHSL